MFFSGTLEGELPRPGHVQLMEEPFLRFSGVCQEQCADLFVTCQVCKTLTV